MRKGARRRVAGAHGGPAAEDDGGGADPRLDRREGNRHRVGTAADRRRVRAPAETRHATADRSDRDLRHGQRLRTATSAARDLLSRHALQHLHARRPAADADRDARRRRAACGRRGPPPGDALFFVAVGDGSGRHVFSRTARRTQRRGARIPAALPRAVRAEMRMLWSLASQRSHPWRNSIEHGTPGPAILGRAFGPQPMPIGHRQSVPLIRASSRWKAARAPARQCSPRCASAAGRRLRSGEHARTRRHAAGGDDPRPAARPGARAGCRRKPNCC